jgi:alkyldihydroxyacetonephosphate synthase
MVDLKHFDAIGAVDADARCIEAGAGVIGETLERTLASRGWTLGHFPSSIYMSTVGGWLAARSAGQLSSRYGKIEDMTLSVRVVTGRGETLVTPSRPRSGPDLASLLIGSEGTLGFFTSATLRVFPAPTGRAFRGFELGSVDQGLEAIRQLFRSGLRPAVVRLYDPFDTAFVGKPKPVHKGKAPMFQSKTERDLVPSLLRVAAAQVLGRPKLLNLTSKLFNRSRLIVMFEGEATRVGPEIAEAQRILQRLGASDLGEEPGLQWFQKRYDVSYRMSKVIDSGAFADTMEVAAPWEKVHAVYERVRAAASPHAFVLCHFSHAYLEGCSLYFSFVGSGEDEDDTQRRYQALWRDALSAAVSAGANVSHHHGIGLLKADVFQQSLGEGRHALKALKTHFDPDGVMNPGKLGL